MHDVVPLGTKVSSEQVEESVRVFRDYQFERYGLLMIGACIVNAFGLGLILWLSPERVPGLIPIAIIVVLGPAWLCDQYFFRPARLAARLGRTFPTSVGVSVDASRILLSLDGKDSSVPWRLVKAVLEGEAVFLLVLSPFTFLFLPSVGLTEQAYKVLHAKAQSRSA